MKQIELPKVSVIIPCYNREPYIAATIDSVFTQTWTNIELIVVDDGCTDGSRRILESYGDQIVLLEHPGRTNRGQSASINLGIRSCSGAYIAILDSDDLFAQDKIEKQVRYLETNPEIGLVYANGKYVDADGKDIWAIYPKDHAPPADPGDVLLDCCINLPSNSLVRSSVYEKAGLFDETLRSAQDHDMVLRIVEVTGVGYINEILWFYRRHGGSISSTKAMERWKNGFKILAAACARYPYPRRVRNQRAAVLHFRLGQCYLEGKKYLRAGIHFIRAGLLDPLRSLAVICGREGVSSPH